MKNVKEKSERGEDTIIGKEKKVQHQKVKDRLEDEVRVFLLRNISTRRSSLSVSTKIIRRWDFDWWHGIKTISRIVLEIRCSESNKFEIDELKGQARRKVLEQLDSHYLSEYEVEVKFVFEEKSVKGGKR